MLDDEPDQYGRLGVIGLANWGVMAEPEAPGPTPSCQRISQRIQRIQRIRTTEHGTPNPLNPLLWNPLSAPRGASVLGYFQSR